MTKDIETDNAGERAAVTLSAMKMILKWHPEGTAKSLRNAIYVLMEDITSGEWGLLYDGDYYTKDGAEVFGLTTGEFTATEERQLRDAAASAGYEIVSISREHSERYRRDVYILRVSFNRTAPEIPF